MEDRGGRRGLARVVGGLGPQPHSVAETYDLRAGGDGPVEDLGVRAVRVLLEEVVLDGPEGVEADLVAEDGLLDRVLVGPVLAVAIPRASDGDLVEERELHGRRDVDSGDARLDGGARCIAPDA